MAIRITDIIRFMNPAIISLVANFSQSFTATITEIAKGNTIFAVIIVISVCSEGSNPSREMKD